MIKTVLGIVANFFFYKSLCIVLALDTQLAEANKRGPTKD